MVPGCRRIQLLFTTCPLESELIPYSASQGLPAQAVLVLAPHPDDEVFGCGGAIIRHVQVETCVQVVILTSGGAFGDTNIRVAESMAAATVLGYGQPDFWGLPDRGLLYSEALVLRVVEKIISERIDLVYAPSPWEIHPDHRQTMMVAIAAVQRAPWAVRLAFYEVGSPLRPNILLDITPVLGRKDEAMRCFESQLSQQDYLRHIRALNQYRSYTLPASVQAAEAYWVLTTAELNQLTLSDQLNMVSPGLLGEGAALQAVLPLVSVLIRSSGETRLAEALDSLALQTYRHIEVLVVSMQANHPPLPARCGSFPLRLIQTDVQLRPAQAANRAMTQASGELLLFLNEQDWLMPEHIARLAHVLAHQPYALVAYTGVSVVNAGGGTVGQTLELPFDAIRQLAGNLVPIQALLFKSSVLTQGCRFDEALERHEDWDFWLQLARLAPFVHLPGVSAAYRMRDDSVLDTDSRPTGEAVNIVYEKWSTLWSSSQIDQIMQRVWSHPQLETRLADTQRQLASAEVFVANNQHLLELQQQQLMQQQQHLIERQQQLDAVRQENGALKVSVAQQSQEIEFIHKEHGTLKEDLAQQQSRLNTKQQENSALQETLALRQQLIEDTQQENSALHETLLQQQQQIDAARQVTSALEESQVRLLEQANSIFHSRSWRLTAPLRQIMGIFPLVHQLLKRNWFDRATYRALLISIYMRSQLLRGIHQKYRNWKFRAASSIHSLSSSSDNSLALQSLSSRRFLNSSLLSASSAVHPAVWPEINLSVVSYNSSRWLEPFFTALVSQSYPLARIHLHFVDHGSQDDTLQQLKELLAGTGTRFASVKITEQKNLGFGAGHDRAIMGSMADYCLVANLDLEFAPDSICEAVLVALSDTDGEVASWEFRQSPYEHPKYYDPVTLETNWSSHACTLIRRSAYIEVGGYDRGIFMYAEDVELSYRFRSYGYALKYIPRAVVQHHTYESAEQIKPLQFCGSTIGNIYIRIRYGKAADRFAACLLYARLFLKPSPFPGAKTAMFKNMLGAITKTPHFLRGKGRHGAYFPLRGFDYEMIRDGAFWKVRPFLATDVAPLVSIVTRTYRNRNMFLRQSVQSVFNQTYPAIELVVVEDGGDSQQALVESLAKSAPDGITVRFFANGKLGRSAAGNVGLASSTGQYLMFLDDDDLLLSDHVETLMAALTRNCQLSAAYALSMEVQTDVAPDMSTYTELSFHTPGLFRQEWDYKVLLHHNFIPIQAIIFKRDLYEQHGGFNLTLDQLEDWNLWLRYGYKNQFAYIAKTTSLFRSPAKPEVRSARHDLLHKAYNEAKEAALKSLRLETGEI